MRIPELRAVIRPDPETVVRTVAQARAQARQETYDRLAVYLDEAAGPAAPPPPARQPRVTSKPRRIHYHVGPQCFALLLADVRERSVIDLVRQR